MIQAENNSSSLECKIVSKAQKRRGKLFGHFWKIWSFFGLPYFWLILAIIFFFLGNFLVPALFMIITMSYVFIVAPLKLIIKRPRPQQKCDNVESLISKRKFSFPSGHTFIATSFGLVLAFYFDDFFWFIAMLFLGIMVGTSRVFLGAHFLSDVLFSYTMAVVVVILIFWFLSPLVQMIILIFQSIFLLTSIK
ncbi:MAG: phosphatase PAP2 family protein [Promethearchaeota archaeon]|nr:MAG: phosphatase PAP2 family protein [Candidatus Lokiarchaeota archaeon]